MIKTIKERLRLAEKSLKQARHYGFQIAKAINGQNDYEAEVISLLYELGIKQKEDGDFDLEEGE
jgi:hypothetical protein